MKPILYFLKNFLVVILWTIIITLFISIYSHIYLAGKISEYRVISEQICCPTSLQSFIINKELAIHYNGWLAFWQQIDKLPVGDYFVPDAIKGLKPIVISLPTKEPITADSADHEKLEQELIKSRLVIYELKKEVNSLKRTVKRIHDLN